LALPAKHPAQARPSEKRSLGQGLFRKCDGCGSVFTTEQFAESFEVCPSCGHHHPLAPEEWQKLLLDDASLERWDEHISPNDPLGFFDGKRYAERLERARRATGRSEAIEIGKACIDGRPLAYGCFMFPFMGGSMGSVVGERLTRLFERGCDLALPVVLLHASGGARMQEGILSLMEMAKTVSALARYRQIRKPFISVLLHPTTGGVAASTALIGFAGPRVIESTLRTTLPEGFQRSEFLLEHGMVDAIIPRSELKAMLSLLLSHLAGERK
jgi:acetyl-CoA carboxylase carboxyl transferase subunit beta